MNEAIAQRARSLFDQRWNGNSPIFLVATKEGKETLRYCTLETLADSSEDVKEFYRSTLAAYIDGYTRGRAESAALPLAQLQAMYPPTTKEQANETRNLS